MFRFSLQLMWDLTIHSPSGFSIPNRCEISQFIPLRGVRSHNPLPSGPVSPTNVGSHNPPPSRSSVYNRCRISQSTLFQGPVFSLAYRLVSIPLWGPASSLAYWPSVLTGILPGVHPLRGPASSLLHCSVSTPFGAQCSH